jgi:hypothetical protein
VLSDTAKSLLLGTLRRELRPLLGLDLRVNLSFGSVGADDGAHDEPENQSDQNGRRERVDDPAPDGVRHGSTVRRSTRANEREKCDHNDDADEGSTHDPSGDGSSHAD